MMMFAQQAAPEIVWSLILPFVILAIGGMILVTLTSLVPGLRGAGFPAAFTGAVAVVAGAFLIPVWNRVSGTEGPQLVVADAIGVDPFTVYVTAVICVAVFFAAMLLDEYLRREGLDGPEWYVLLLMSASGGVLLASAEDLIVTFLGLEILSIAAYVMAALHLRRTDSQEAGFKYFLLGALSSALFLYGIALVYGATGSTALRSIASAGENAAGLNPLEDSSLILAGMALILVGFAFKVSAVPFHMWTPDVYEGAPTPVVAFMASGVKVAGFAGFVRVFLVGFGPYVADWRPLIAGLAVLTLLLGSVLALVQTNVKRMLAYSSITHAGFILVAFHAAASADASLLGGEALLFYLLAYTIMVVGTFGVVTIVGGRGDGKHHIDDYRGLSRRYPVLAALMSVLLFAQAGVPFTSGFFAKFRVIAAAASDGSYLLAGIAMLAAVVAAVLYLRIVVSMFLINTDETSGAGESDAAESDDVVSGAVESGDSEVEPTGAVSTLTRQSTLASSPALSAVVAVALAAIATIVLGVLPNLGGGVLADAAETIEFFNPGQ